MHPQNHSRHRRHQRLLLCNQSMSLEPVSLDLPWVHKGEPLPPVTRAWGPLSAAPGLLAAGGDLSAERLIESYRQGIFPWFSAGQPVLWWSPDPRMVLQTRHFRFHRSLRQRLKRSLMDARFDLSFDRDFSQVIRRCASAPRPGQKGTWILPPMVSAYEELHRQGFAHSAEIWLDGKLVSGLYFVSIGHAVFGESMFTTIPDGSKMALALLVSVGLHHGVEAIDCQQNTRHLASLGAIEIPREAFIQSVQHGIEQPAIDWARETLYWPLLTALDNRSDPSE